MYVCELKSRKSPPCRSNVYDQTKRKYDHEILKPKNHNQCWLPTFECDRVRPKDHHTAKRDTETTKCGDVERHRDDHEWRDHHMRNVERHVDNHKQRGGDSGCTTQREADIWVCANGVKWEKMSVEGVCT